MLHTFFDLHVNFMEFDIGDAIDFICFFAFKCNGTSVVAEIHRRIMDNIDGYAEMHDDSENMYDFLCMVNKEFPGSRAIGSCTEPRYTFSSGSNSTDWSQMTGKLHELCMKYWDGDSASKSRVELKNVTNQIVSLLVDGKDKATGKPLFCGVGGMGANQFIHIAALLGIIPLVCYTFAELRDISLGPALLIKGVFPPGHIQTANQCNDYLHMVQRRFSDIWNGLATENLLENTMCNCFRSFQFTKKFVAKKTGIPIDDIPLSIIMESEYRKESRTKDVFYMDEQRGTVQSFFSLRFSGKGSSNLHPSLVMKDASRWSEGDRANLVLTNWTGTLDDKKMCYWEHHGSLMCLKTKLSVSTEFEKVYKIL